MSKYAPLSNISTPNVSRRGSIIRAKESEIFRTDKKENQRDFFNRNKRKPSFSKTKVSTHSQKSSKKVQLKMRKGSVEKREKIQISADKKDRRRGNFNPSPDYKIKSKPSTYVQKNRKMVDFGAGRRKGASKSPNDVVKTRKIDFNNLTDTQSVKTTGKSRPQIIDESYPINTRKTSTFGEIRNITDLSKKNSSVFKTGKSSKDRAEVFPSMTNSGSQKINSIQDIPSRLRDTGTSTLAGRSKVSRNARSKTPKSILKNGNGITARQVAGMESNRAIGGYRKLNDFRSENLIQPVPSRVRGVSPAPSAREVSISPNRYTPSRRISNRTPSRRVSHAPSVTSTSRRVSRAPSVVSNNRRVSNNDRRVTIGTPSYLTPNNSDKNIGIGTPRRVTPSNNLSPLDINTRLTPIHSPGISPATSARVISKPSNVTAIGGNTAYPSSRVISNPSNISPGITRYPSNLANNPTSNRVISKPTGMTVSSPYRTTSPYPTGSYSRLGSRRGSATPYRTSTSPYRTSTSPYSTTPNRIGTPGRVIAGPGRATAVSPSRGTPVKSSRIISPYGNRTANIPVVERVIVPAPVPQQRRVIAVNPIVYPPPAPKQTIVPSYRPRIPEADRAPVDKPQIQYPKAPPGPVPPQKSNDPPFIPPKSYKKPEKINVILPTRREVVTLEEKEDAAILDKNRFYNTTRPAGELDINDRKNIFL